MRTINNIYYNFTFKQDKYLLTNKQLVDLEYNLYYLEDTKEDKLIKNDIILGTADEADKTITLPLNKDGRYRLDLVDINPPNNSIYFKHSLGKRNLIIKGLRKAICKHCRCKDDCDGCMTKEAKMCLTNQSLFNLVQQYLYINKDFSLSGFPIVSPKTYNYYTKYFNDNYDYLNHELSKQCLNNILSGSSSVNQDLFAIYLGVYYIGWYLEAKAEIDGLDKESLDYLDKVYNYKELSDCIKKLGIDMNELEEDFNYETINVFYWQLEIDQTFDDLQTLFNANYLSTKANQSLDTFQQGFNVPQGSIGKQCFAINNINNQSVILNDALGNDVTDNFETFYDIPTRSIVFCSIPSYITGSLFFKFKTL